LKKALLVDDNSDNLYYLKVLTQTHNLESVEARNGQEALDILRNEKIDLIISDILMPVMDGFNLCKKCKEDVNLKKIPFIFYTATYTDESDKKFALQLGADKFLIKPSEPEVLIEAIDEILDDYENIETKIETALPVNDIQIDEKEYYKDYSETLIRKLEKKMLDLELMNKELTAAKDKAEEMNRLKTSFLANMSHEIRTPMVGILGIADVLKNESEDFWVQKMAGIILRSASRLMETLSQILDLSSLEAENLKITTNKFDLVNTLREIIELFLETAVEKDLYIRTEMSVNALNIVSDERMIRQALSNLVNNAVKFTEAGGITISLSTEKRANGEAAVIKIADTGIGISDKNQKSIWEEFRQVSEGWGRNFEGTGLGLSITKKIVDKINGKIVLNSAEGVGSVITLEIPIITDDSVPVEKPADQVAVKKEIPLPAKRKKVLLVDDDQINLAVINDFLKNHYIVDCVSKGKDAVEMAKNNSYDLILMDINLGSGMNGLEAASEIKKFEGYEKIPVIAMTAYALIGDKERFIEEGCTHYISKPFEKTELLDFLSGVLSGAANYLYN
jgi:signal transduction histidine kinase